MKPPNSAELLRNRVKLAVSDRGRRRALMRAMGLKSQGTITQWLDYAEHNPGVDKLDSIAAFLGVSVSELFDSDLAAHHLRVTSYDRPSGLISASDTSEGAPHGTEARLLKQISDQQRKYDRLLEEFRKFTTEVGGAAGYFVDLAKKVAKVAVEESSPSRYDRGHDRQLPQREVKKRKGGR